LNTQVKTSKYNLAQLSFLIACGSALQITEAFIPSLVPIPGIRIGLANIATLIGLALFGVPAALEIAVFRPVVTSLAAGTFLSPTLVVSFCASIISCLIMAAAYRVLGGSSRPRMITVSIIGALAHAAAQLLVAYLWLIPHLAIFALAPLMLIWSVIGGYLVGWSSAYVLQQIAAHHGAHFPAPAAAVEAALPAVLTVKDKVKIITAFGMVISTAFLGSATVYLFLIVLVLTLIVIYGQPVPLARFWHLGGAVIFSFVLPVLFTPGGGEVLWRWWIITITEQGIAHGVLFALRLSFLIFISIWIGVTEPARLSQELAWILSPLKYFRFSVDRIPRITSLSLSFIPVVWERFAQVKPKRLRTVLDALAAFFAGLDPRHPGQPPADRT
jgi:heptaprenyl diphosphate synthase